MAVDPRTILKQSILNAMDHAKEATLLEKWEIVRINLGLALACAKKLEDGDGKG